VTIATFLIFAVHGGWWLLLALTILEAALLAAGIYVLMMTVASVERDNEAKAHSLEGVNDNLRRYTGRIREELAHARRTQHNFLPDLQRMPLPASLEWAAHFAPEAEVGGDYYDAAKLPGNRAAMLLCDVSGHGMGAALIATLVKSAFLAWTDEAKALDDFIRQANSNLCRFTPEGAFAAVIACEYDAREGTLRYVNSGHTPRPVLVPADPARPPVLLSGRGSMILGVLADIQIELATVELAPGDSIFLITDGLTEAMNAGRELLGIDRLLRVIAANRQRGLQEIVDALSAEVDRFAAGVESTDDKTVLAMRVRRP